MAYICQHEKPALAIFHGLQAGRIDRTLLTPNLRDYFSPEALADFQTAWCRCASSSVSARPVSSHAEE
jgi:hypothetical protein